MVTAAILEKLEALPTPLKTEVVHFIEFLTERYLSKFNDLEEQGEQPSLFGVWKGEISMSDDFDEPLDDMQDYM